MTGQVGPPQKKINPISNRSHFIACYVTNCLVNRVLDPLRPKLHLLNSATHFMQSTRVTML